MNEPEDKDRSPSERGEPAADQVPTTPAPTVHRSPRRFLRSHDDRVIAGVCGGLGRYFDIDPLIIRIAFAVTVLFGGLGFFAYLAVALFAPADDGTGQPAAGGRGREIVQIFAILAIAILAAAAFGLLAAAATVLTGFGLGLPVAIVIVVIGIALAALSFRGGARWLILPALALAIGVGIASAVDLDLEGGIGNREYRPESATAIPAGGYELGVGRLAVDLRGIGWPRQRVLSLDTRVGAGQLVVVVPSRVCVVADAHVGAGVARVAGQQSDGLGVDLTTGAGAKGTPQLRVDAEVDAGEIRVINDDDVPIDRLDQLTQDRLEGGAGLRAANARACAA